VLRPLTPEISLDGSLTSLDDSNSELKSPISVLYEKALMRNLQVQFEVQSEKGPPHMKSFITTCRIGTLVVSLVKIKKKTYEINIIYLQNNRVKDQEMAKKYQNGGPLKICWKNLKNYRQFHHHKN